MPALPVALIARLARKELREILRDRRTIITLVLMPVLLYPLLGMAFRYFLLSVAPATSAQQYRIVMHNEDELRLLVSLLELKKEDPDLPYIYNDDLEAAIRAGDADVGIEMKGADQPFPNLDPRQHYECLILRRGDSAIAIKAEEFISERLAQANIKLLRLRLQAFGRGGEPAVPVQTELRVIEAAAARRMSYVAALIPLVLVLMTITGAVYPAIDLTAGERERGTLEILMAAPIPRVGLLFAKYVSVWVVAVLTALVNLGMMTATVLISGLGPLLFGSHGLSRSEERRG